MVRGAMGDRQHFSKRAGCVLDACWMRAGCVLVLTIGVAHVDHHRAPRGTAWEHINGGHRGRRHSGRRSGKRGSSQRVLCIQEVSVVRTNIHITGGSCEDYQRARADISSHILTRHTRVIIGSALNIRGAVGGQDRVASPDTVNVFDRSIIICFVYFHSESVCVQRSVQPGEGVSNASCGNVGAPFPDLVNNKYCNSVTRC